MNPLLLALALLPTAEPEFVLESVRDERPVGALTRLDANGTTQVGGSTPVPGSDVVALRRRDPAPPHFPHDRPHALFANGDRVPGIVQDIVGETVQFRADLGSPRDMRLPLSTLAALFLTERAAIRAAEPVGRRLLAEKRRQDVVWLSNGDTLAGTVAEMAPRDKPLRLDANDIARDRIDAILFNSELARPHVPRGPYRFLVLRDGTRLSLKASALDSGELACETLGGVKVRYPLEDVAAIKVYQAKAVYLSDRLPGRYEHTPYLGIPWPVAANRSVAGLDLRLSGGTYDKGIGLHSQCRATYAVPPGTVRFEALVGLDEVTGRGGAVRASVAVDGRALAPAVDLTATDPPKELRLAVPRGSKELTLVVEFGRGGDVQDHVDWADARFIVGR